MRISTPEGVDLELTLAGVGSRFTAGLIDFLIQSVLLGAVILLFVGIGSLGEEGGRVAADSDDGAALGVAIVAILSFLIIFTYDVLFEVRGGGRTPGKRMTGLRVVRTSGRPVGFVTSATRNILRLVDSLPIFYGVGMSAIFASQRNQRLGDMAAGTVVVRDRKGGRPARGGAAVAAVGEPALDTAGWDVSAVTAEEVATVRQFLERRGTLSPSARSQLAAQFASRLRAKVAGAPEDAQPEDFLEGVSAAKAARADP